MIERYSLPQMGKVWSQNNRWQCLLEVEQTAAVVQASMGIIPRKAAQEIVKKGKFQPAKIAEIEKTTRHDVIAFVTNVADNIGPSGRYVHYGLTSSDVLDTALSLQIQEAWELLEEKFKSLEAKLKKLIKAHEKTICVGRTHGMHGEPTTFGLKMAGHLAEMKRNHQRVKNACLDGARVKLSGAVGTYAALSPEFEKKVGKKLKLACEDIATQVIPRDRHAEIMCALAMTGAGLERLSVEIRHLQRTEVAEAEESFKKGQKGSSAMPHKRNPIASENITGIARLLRGYMVSSMENVALWHERDISHSSVERVIFPDAFILTDYALNRVAQVVGGLVVKKDQMKQNLKITQGQIYSSHVLLALVRNGLKREDAYKVVQGHAHSLKPGQDLEKKLKQDKSLKEKISSKELNDIFSGKIYQKFIPSVIKRVTK